MEAVFLVGPSYLCPTSTSRVTVRNEDDRSGPDGRRIGTVARYLDAAEQTVIFDLSAPCDPRRE